MAAPALDAYLGSLQAVLQESCAEGKPVTVVLGNESADLDSIVSALTYAFLLHTKASSGSTVVPVVNIAREDFVLRTETVFIFKRLKLDPQGLVFIDDVNLAELHAEQRLELVLVDHNRLGPQQAALEPAIIEILDHHDDQGAYPSGTACDIRPVGSTTTLVTERALAAAAEDDSASTFVVQLKYAALLLSGILVDTVNLDSSKGRCTEPDVAAAKALTALIDIDNTELFQQLQTAKGDIGTLSAGDLLRKDYKQIEVNGIVVGFASVVAPLATFFQKPDAEEAHLKLCARLKLDALVVMTTCHSPTFSRELLVYIASENTKLSSVVPSLVSDGGLELTPLEPGRLWPTAQAFNQGATKKSRKVVLPLISDLLSKM